MELSLKAKWRTVSQLILQLVVASRLVSTEHVTVNSFSICRGRTMLLLIWINLLAGSLPRTVISRGTQTTVLQIGLQTDPSSTQLTMFTERPIPSPTQQRTTPGPIPFTPTKPPCKCCLTRVIEIIRLYFWYFFIDIFSS